MTGPTWCASFCPHGVSHGLHISAPLWLSAAACPPWGIIPLCAVIASIVSVVVIIPLGHKRRKVLEEGGPRRNVQDGLEALLFMRAAGARVARLGQIPRPIWQPCRVRGSRGSCQMPSGFDTLPSVTRRSARRELTPQQTSAVWSPRLGLLRLDVCQHSRCSKCTLLRLSCSGFSH